MKNLVLFLALIFATTALRAQTPEQMKVWTDYMTPSEAHKNLAKYNGEWKAEVTMWMAENQPPIKSTGTTVNEMIMGDRYQSSSFNAIMMGQPFEGKSITSFDNATKKYQSIWIDNMGTGMMVLEGTMEEGSNIIKMSGEMVDPMSGEPLPVRQELVLVNDNKQIFKMYMTHFEKEFQSMEIIYTRANNEVKD